MIGEIEKLGYPYICRYRPNNDYTLDEIENSYIYFSDREKLNDPKDSNPNYLFNPIFEKDRYSQVLKKFAKSVKRNGGPDLTEVLKFRYPDSKSLKRYINSYFESIVNEKGIACFSITPLQTVLWETYAKNHQGICIQYNMHLDKPFFEDLAPIKYVSKFTKYDFEKEDYRKALHYLFHTKLKSWSKELEFRIVKDQSGKHHYNPDSIRSISFGFETDENYKSQVIEIVKNYHPHIKLYNTSLIPNGLGLTFEQIII